MCGPSSALKAINSQVQQFSNQVTQESGTVFGASNQVFNNIMNSVQQIVQGGPSQMGYSQSELNDLNAAAVQNGGTMARNLKGAAASSAAAVGGGNTVTPAGGTQAGVRAAEIAAASTTAQTENQILESGFETGRKNYESAVNSEENLPNVFNASTNANNSAVSAQQDAVKSQQNIDTSSNWWANDIMQLGSAAIGGFTSGLTGGLGKNLAGKMISPTAPSSSGGGGDLTS